MNKHPMADTVTKMLISCYEVLGDPAARREYDAYMASRIHDLGAEREDEERREWERQERLWEEEYQA